MSSNWTAERVALLRKYWAEGLSASQIARRVGVVSRNGVIGKIHRLGMAGHAPANKARKRVLTQSNIWGPKLAKGEPAMEPAPMPPPAVDDVARVSFAQLEDHHCRFIPGEPTDGFCGLDKVPGTSYCGGHLQRCTTAPAPRYSERSQGRVIGWHKATAIAMNLTTKDASDRIMHPVDIRDLETIT
jgi:GcrA cell cycle regulator